ncbi:zonadhesin [Caerostris extrusa]|uniref:Zonadhesin n=1 Tax=Caerostris extrusa TaxID=172846 RepID=A0AAV4Q0B8_CAEEX|nr:zonadhesin [Caerostris extrusa]
MWTVLLMALCSSLQKEMRPLSMCHSLCSGNEEFVDSMNPCRTCEGMRGHCSSVSSLEAGCDCIEGFYRNRKGVCVPEEKCKEDLHGGCRENEEFLECGCHKTCCNGKRTEGCSCTQGCFCKDGLVRHEDGRCVRLEECGPESKNTCGKNEVYKECGSACPATCSNLGKNLVCTLQCVPGCFCEDGLVRNEQGECVAPEQCSKEKCKPDEQFYECMPLCYGTCSAYTTNSHLYCKMACRSGCFCKEGLYQREDGTCVPPSQCTTSPSSPIHTCGKNEEYNECGSACPDTCANLGKPQFCTLQCVPGCNCKRGMVKNDKGECVDPQECQQSTCPENEEYSSCASPCNTCTRRGKCKLTCKPGCDCKAGFYRDWQGKCIPKKDCPRIDPPRHPSERCGKNQQYYGCVPSCQGTCSAFLRKSRVLCRQLCKPGCFCKKGLYMRKDGQCVPPTQCSSNTPTTVPGVTPPTTGQCPENEESSDCVVPCNDCQTRGKCNFLVCNKGCDCKKGYYRDFNGRCIPEFQCPLIDPTPPTTGLCPENEESSNCVVPCNDCQTRGKCNFLVCNKGCDCKKGYYRDFNGRCIPELQCPLIDPTPPTTGLCPENEESSNCVVPCNDCQTRGKCNFLVCNKGCDCKKGYYRDFNGRCIPEFQCPLIDPIPVVKECSDDEEYYDCMPSCQQTCTVYTSKFKIACKQRCQQGCFCKKGLYKRDDGKCVRPSKCTTPRKKCPRNEKYSYCVVPCNDCQTRGKCNFLVCNKGCDCKKGYYRDFNGRCIPEFQCPLIDPTPPTTGLCPENEESSDCVVPCNDCQTRGKCNFLVCNKGCDCKKGYYRDFDGRCISELQCPIIDPIPPSEECRDDQQFYECIPRCSQTCAAYTRKEKIFCNQLCVSGCFCKEGLYQRDDDTCVPPEQCTAPTTTTPGKPTPSCGRDEQYYGCIPTCKNTCENYQVKHPICPLICRSGCFCRKGLVKRSDGKCVQPSKCQQQPSPPTKSPPEQCGEDEEYYNDCAPKCTGTCEAYNNPGVRNCPSVDPVAGPPTRVCGPDEGFYECIPTCKNTCENYQAQHPICPRICRRGCFCRKGLVKRSDGKCVQPSDCQQSPSPPAPTTPPPDFNPTCQLERDSGPCRAAMSRYYYNYRRKRCERFTYGGCKGNKNNFKTEEDCRLICGGTIPPSDQCRDDQQFYECIPSCSQTCTAYTRKEKIFCNQLCVSGCFCKEGLYQGDDGTCVPPEQCTAPTTTTPGIGSPTHVCGPDDEFYECIPTCKNTCENYQAQHPICPRICRRGCFCRKGLVKRNDGKCVQPSDCQQPPSPPVPTNNSTCQLEMDSGPCRGAMSRYYYNHRRKRCERFTYGGCKGNENNFKTEEECRLTCGGKPTCAEDEQYYQCIPNCHNTCDTFRMTNVACAQVCTPGCFCKKGMVRNKAGKCVETSQCPPEDNPSTILLSKSISYGPRVLGGTDIPEDGKHTGRRSSSRTP